jgi:hypothetical protein
MKPGLSIPRGARWAVPAVTVAAVALGLTGVALAGAQSAPRLPARSAAQLLAAVQRSGPLPAMTAAVQETGALGLPSLPDTGTSSAPLQAATSLASGTNAFQFWYAGPEHVRIAEPAQLGETDLRQDGRQVWLWDSRDQTATHIVLPAARGGRVPSAAAAGPVAALTPQQAARKLLAAAGPGTSVSVQRNVTVARQAAYQLSVVPKSSRTLVGRVLIAVDSARYFPLRVQVFARGAASPAFSVAYTSVTLGRPAASNFSFTPPHGAKVNSLSVSSPGNSPASRALGSSAPAAQAPKMLGKGWLSVLVLRGAGTSLGALSGGAASPAPSAGASGEDQAVLAALLKSARQVHGSWGSGRLLRTSLVSVLITSKGELLAGAVTPSVLYADAASMK